MNPAEKSETKSQETGGANTLSPRNSDRGDSGEVKKGFDFPEWLPIFVKEFEETKLKPLRERFDKDEKNVDETLGKIVEKFDTKIQDSKTQLIETLGLFTALFTFVSIEFKFLENVKNFLELVSLSLILGSFLILFILILDVLIRDWQTVWKENSVKGKKYEQTIKKLFICAISILGLGIFMGFCRLNLNALINNFRPTKNLNINSIKNSVPSSKPTKVVPTI